MLAAPARIRGPFGTDPLVPGRTILIPVPLRPKGTRWNRFAFQPVTQFIPCNICGFAASGPGTGPGLKSPPGARGVRST